MDRKTLQAIDAFSFLQSGIAPLEKSYREWPFSLMSFFKVITSERDMIRHEEVERAKAIQRMKDRAAAKKGY